MNFLINAVIGFLIALSIIFLARKFFPNKDHAFWRMGLVIAALIYLVFVFVGGQLEHLPMELGGVAVYSLFAWLSKKYTLHWLAVGWAMHMCWDVFLHSTTATPYVPGGYAAACVGFDIAIASYIIWLISKKQFA